MEEQQEQKKVKKIKKKKERKLFDCIPLPSCIKVNIEMGDGKEFNFELGDKKRK